MNTDRPTEPQEPRQPAAGNLVEEAIVGYLDRLNSGESLDPKNLLVDHPRHRTRDPRGPGGVYRDAHAV